MKLIEIRTDKKITTTKFKTEIINHEINGVKWSKEVKTGIPDSMHTSYEIYWIPVDKIYQLKRLDENCWINHIKVSPQEFDRIKTELENI